MKTLIIYTSVHHQNTAKVARAMAEALHADLMESGQVRPANIESYDLIGFGSGIFFGKHHQSLLQLADRIPAQTGKKAFLFSTCGTKRPAYHQALRTKLQEKGWDIAGEFSCRGFDTFGPLQWIGGISKGRPNDQDLADAIVFVTNLVD